MSLGRQASESKQSPLARARYDREPVEGEAAETQSRTGGPFSLATIWQIPVGYQDETGFHCGKPQVEGADPGFGSSTFYF